MAEVQAEIAGLLERVQDQDEAAAQELVERLYPLVRRIARAHRPSRMDEEDLCQEVFMSILTSLRQYRGQVPFEHWVSRVAVNTCIDHLRKHRCRPELRWADLGKEEAESLQAMLADHAETSPENVAGARELVSRLLDSLDPQDRLLIQWLELEDRAVADVSALTGWGKSMIKVRAFRARHRMRKALERIIEQEKP